MEKKIRIRFKKLLNRLLLPIFLGALLMLSSCGSSRTISGGVDEYQELQELVSSREFAIENTWLQPLTGSRVNLIGNDNYMRFKNDSVSLDLPYYGERYSGGGYDRDGGINYEGPLKNLDIIEDPEDRRIRINFEAQQKNENLWFSLILFPNGKVYTSVRSSQRSSVSYDGEIKPLPEKFE